ncbi:MAG: BMP family ABC transporter substrate-binding protein [Alphaproteobacteria bacterium]|nr:MAG: BMP family ABC transporter substrate-binding protein [Alphaproteobacteria bacterium]
MYLLWAVCFCVTWGVSGNAYAQDARDATPDLPATKDTFKSAILYEYSGEDGDQGFIDLVREGARQAKKNIGIDYTEFRITEEKERLVVLEEAIRSGYRYIIAVGVQNTIPVLTLASSHPEVKFTVIDSVIPPLYENIQSISFKDHEGAYLVGILAANLSPTETVGFIGGMDVPLIQNFALGYFQGAQHHNPNIAIRRDVVGVTAEAWNNPERAKILARKQYHDGVGVIFAAAGGSSIGVLEAAKEMGTFAIGVDTNQNHLYPGTVITSMVKRVDKAIYEALIAAHSGRWKAGTHYLGLKEGALDYAIDIHNKDKITLAMINEVEKARDQIIRGIIHVEVFSKGY